MSSVRENPYPIRYFGYGAMRDFDMVTAVIGRMPQGIDAGLNNYELIIQRLPDVPEQLRAGLEETWGPNFRAYRIKPKPGESVDGVVWEVNAAELELIRNWEGTGIWTDSVEVEAISGYSRERLQVISDAVSVESSGTVAIGFLLPTFLNGKEAMLRIAALERETYLKEHEQPGKER